MIASDCSYSLSTFLINYGISLFKAPFKRGELFAFFVIINSIERPAEWKKSRTCSMHNVSKVALLFLDGGPLRHAKCLAAPEGRAPK